MGCFCLYKPASLAILKCKMPTEKKLILLTPAVLHRTALDSLKEKDRRFHYSYVFRFAIIQGLWAVIFYLIIVALAVIPALRNVRETVEKVLTNANFTQVAMKDGQLAIDIKPAIWVFTVNDSKTEQSVVAVDSIGTMNRFYWDDRVEKGVVKRIDGVGFMKDGVFVKKGTWIRKMPYESLSKYRPFSMSKGELHSSFKEMTEKRTFLKLVILCTPVVFILAMLLGAVGHVLFMWVTGFILALFTKNFSKNLLTAVKLSSGLYVGWIYVFVLSLIASHFLTYTWTSFSYLFAVVKIVSYITILFIGYLSISEYKIQPNVNKESNDKRR